MPWLPLCRIHERNGREKEPRTEEGVCNFCLSFPIGRGDSGLVGLLLENLIKGQSAAAGRGG